MDMRVKDFDEFKRPSRKPWLLLIVLVIGAGVLVHRHRGRPESGPDPASGPVAAEAEAVPETAGEGDAPSVTRSPRVETPEDVRALYRQARELKQADDLLGARRAYLAVLQRAEDARLIRSVQERLGAIHIELILTPRPMPAKEEYVVQRGDFVQRIARQFGTTVELVKVGNRIADANMIRIGDRLQVFAGSFAIRVSKSRRELVVLMNDEFFKRYAVGIGRNDKTPEGTFAIAEKQKEPVWWPRGREIPFGHPDNVLGTRWLSLRATGQTADVRGYGIHGTWEPETIGAAESDGCIRMTNSDVEELYIYIPIGTPVRILP